MTDVVLRAREYALKAHEGCMYGDRPYIVHLDDVANLAELFSQDPILIAAAYLHDTLEDTKTTYTDILNCFGEDVAGLVASVTDFKLASRHVRKADTLMRTRAAGSSAVLLKLCDRLANVNASAATDPDKLEMYKTEQPIFEKVLRVAGEHDNVWEELKKAFGD